MGRLVELSRSEGALPDPALIWWKARLLERHAAQARAALPIAIAQWLTLVVAVVTMIVLCAVNWPGIKGMLEPAGFTLWVAVAGGVILMGLAFSTSPTVEPATVTESCFPVNCRSGVGIKTLAISVDQLLFGRLGLVEVRQPAIGVVEFALLNGEHHERIPGAGIPQVGLRKIRVAIRVRVVDADQIHVALAGGAVGGQQIRGPQLIALGLRAFKGVLQRHGYHNAL